MRGKEIIVELRLPNGRDREFSLRAGSNWRAELEAEICKRYPRSSGIEFVDEPRERRLLGGEPYRSGVMFEMRKDYYQLGYIIARIGS